MGSHPVWDPIPYGIPSRMGSHPVWPKFEALRRSIFAHFHFQGIFLFNIIQFQVLTYNKTYNYPPWATGLGILLAAISMIQIPVYLAYKVIRTPGPFLQVRVVAINSMN
jgi:hypothetical protein